MDLGLQGKVAIVTGSSRGLGLASARALVAEGCHVCISARGEEALSQAALELAAAAMSAAEVLAVRADLATDGGMRAVVDATVARFGGVDVLVNNVALARGGDIVTTTDAEWQEAFDQTLFPAIRASRLVVPSMRARGGGAIIIISSIFGREAGGRMTYNAVKAAEISLGKSLAEFLGLQELLHVKLDDEPRDLLWATFARQCSLDIITESGLAFDTAISAAQYAMGANGVFLGDFDMFSQELADGRLVMPYVMAVNDGYGYYLKLHADDLADPAISVFRSWLINRFAAHLRQGN